MQKPKRKKQKSPRGIQSKRAAFEMARQIMDNLEEGQTFEDLDPRAQEPLGVILGIMRGTIRGKFLSTRLNAATVLLHQFRGKPAQKVEADVGATLAELIEKSMEKEEQGTTKTIEAEVQPALSKEEKLEEAAKLLLAEQKRIDADNRDRDMMDQPEDTIQQHRNREEILNLAKEEKESIPEAEILTPAHDGNLFNYEEWNSVPDPKKEKQ